ncbi:hypothetical protein OG851_41980 (plasmid) [Streptomyces sp. NBC_00161]|uniref:hypothetical protein n=1 Tax=Streptomyces sp. NBC_00161 TaxID=2975671 RepID=UPI002F90C3E3
MSPEIGLGDILAVQEAVLAARQAQVAASRASVTRMVAKRAERHPNHGERLHGMDAIHSRLEHMGRYATSEVLSSQPAGRPAPRGPGPASRPADTEALARGITMRTLYRDDTRNQPHVAAYAHWLLTQCADRCRTIPRCAAAVAV